jgi:hypothetical protein
MCCTMSLDRFELAQAARCASFCRQFPREGLICICRYCRRIKFRVGLRGIPDSQCLLVVNVAVITGEFCHTRRRVVACRSWMWLN